MKGYVVIHGHFYQPPRENPWLERIEIQDSAYPFHDWNARIQAECYAPNAVSRILDGQGRITRIVNNYESISFNFGPTLLSWMKEHATGIYEKIIEADRVSVVKRSGHGNAVAQAYNHLIMPLANRRDKITQVVWGIRDFRHHFGRDPEGMWLPETAVDLETLEILHEHGIKFTILSPRQARRVRPAGARSWQEATGGGLDATMPYLVRLPCGGALAIFFYDGAIAHDVAFGGLLQEGDSFYKRLLAALPAGRKTPPLVSVATDGETFGHHHRFGEMALAYVLDQVERNPEVTLTNYGEYLALAHPTHEVEIIEKSSWSCVHGIERWRSNCGCRAGGQSQWSQEWRRPLRESLDWLRYELIRVYGKLAAPLFKKPWQARDDYVDVLLSPSDTVRTSFFAKHAGRPLDPEERIRACELLEMQRHALLMYTSCGWFFDELSGLEGVQVLRYAARAAELARKLSGEPLEGGFLERLAEAVSNIDGFGTGADIYRRFALAVRVHLQEVATHFALCSFFEEYREKTILGCYLVTMEHLERQQQEQATAVVGRLRVRSRITEEEAVFVFAALQQELHDYYCALKACEPEGKEADDEDVCEPDLYGQLAAAVFASLNEAGPAAVLQVIDRFLGTERYTIRDLFKDEQQSLLDTILEGTLEYAGRTMDELYRKMSFLTGLLDDLGHRIPAPFAMAAEIALKRALLTALSGPKPVTEEVRMLLKEIGRWGISIEDEGFERQLRRRFERQMEAFRKEPTREGLRTLNRLLATYHLLPLRINFWKSQNLFHEVLQAEVRAQREGAERGGEGALQWLEELTVLGEGLSINVRAVLASLEPG